MQKEQDLVLIKKGITGDNVEKFDNLTYVISLCDSAATCHLPHNAVGVYNVEEIHETVIIGDGILTQIMKKGTLC